MAVSAIEVREHGKSGPEVVVLHGGPGAQGSVISLAASLAPKYHVFEPRMRHSGSLPLTMDQHVEDLAAVAPRQAVYIGWSWGAMLGLTFAALHPERVKTLILVGSGCYNEESRIEYKQRLRACLGEQGMARLADIEKRMEATDDDGWRDSLLGQMGSLIEKAQAVQAIGSTAGDTLPDARGYEETWADVVRLQQEGVEPARFSSIACPVLMLHGEDDPHPGHSIRDSLRPAIPQLAYIGIASCGHVPWLEHYGRRQFFSALHQWIEGVI